MADEPPKPLNYADPKVEQPPPSTGRKDAIELFREPPAIAKSNLSDVIIWIVSFIVVVAAFLWLVGRWWSAAWD